MKYCTKRKNLKEQRKKKVTIVRDKEQITHDRDWKKMLLR